MNKYELLGFCNARGEPKRDIVMLYNGEIVSSILFVPNAVNTHWYRYVLTKAKDWRKVQVFERIK